MKKLGLTFEGNMPKDLRIDENTPMDLDAFLLITHRRGIDEGHFLAFGNSDKIGKMLYNFYLNCIREHAGELGHILELVASDILAVAQLARRQKLDRGMILEMSEKVNYSH
jgi:hypothetical protein